MKLSPNYFSKRQSFAIFILVLTVVSLELLFVLWPFALPFFHQSDKFLEAQIEKEYQVLQSQSLKTKSSYSGLFNPKFIGFYKGYVCLFARRTEQDVIDRIKHKFIIKTSPLIERIDLNTAAQDVLL
ncbi:MAG: hypothetical protein VXY88_03445 [Bacteroidota bacterium]|nr:hypothetical protein [Bacteroidota bacterium]